jgi:hypothetical protein
VLAISEKSLGADHPDVAISLGYLTALYESLDRHADAEPLHRRTLAIIEKARGPDHPDVARPLGNLAWPYENRSRYADAEPLYRRALAIREKALGPDHSDALLVSHWSVDSEAATRLTTSTFAAMKTDPKLGRAGALRSAMLVYMNDRSSPLNAYPAFWGPFSIKGPRDEKQSGYASGADALSRSTRSTGRCTVR